MPVTIENIQAAVAIRALPQLSTWDDADRGFAALHEQLPSNTDRAHVLVKAAAIDKLYATREASIYWVADAVIAAMRRLESVTAEERPTIVDVIDWISNEKTAAHDHARRCDSFASKYCHFFVDSTQFPIYDSFALAGVMNVLGRVRPGQLSQGRSDYRDFCERVALLRIRDNLQAVSVRDMDRFLWLWGQKLLHGAGEATINVDVGTVFDSPAPHVRGLVDALEPA